MRASYLLLLCGPSICPADARGGLAGFSCLPVEEEGLTTSLVGVCSSQACFVNMLLHLFLRGLRVCQAECDMRQEEAPSLSTQVLYLGFLLALCVCRGDISQHIAKIAQCCEGGPGFKEATGEKAIFAWQCTIYTVYQELCVWAGGWLYVQFRNRIKACAGGSVVKNPPANAEDRSSILGLGRSPGGGSGNPLQYSDSHNPMDKGA